MQNMTVKNIFNLINKIYNERQILEEICLVFSVEMNCYVAVQDKSGKFLFKNDDASPKFETEDATYELFAELTYGVENIGSVTVKRQGSLFNDFEEQAFYAFASVISLLLRSFDDRDKENIERVKSAMGSLSYSELTAAIHVFEALEGKSGYFIAGGISKDKGISKSAIVNCLKKLESAGLIEVRSLGVKGTHVRVLNETLAVELEKLTMLSKT